MKVAQNIIIHTVTCISTLPAIVVTDFSNIEADCHNPVPIYQLLLCVISTALVAGIIGKSKRIVYFKPLFLVFQGKFSCQVKIMLPLPPVGEFLQLFQP